MKVEVEVLVPFGDAVYGKERKVGDKFICDKELALQRKGYTVKGKPLVKILRVVPNNTPEEEKNPIDVFALLREKINKEEEGKTELPN